jgi:hypothetical protein
MSRLIELYEKAIDWFQVTFEIDYYQLILIAFLAGVAVGLLALGIVL